MMRFLLLVCAVGALAIPASSHYPYYPHRVTQELSGTWDFVFTLDFNITNDTNVDTFPKVANFDH